MGLRPRLRALAAALALAAASAPCSPIRALAAPTAPGIPASKVSVTGATNSQLQAMLDQGELAQARSATTCSTQTGGTVNELCRQTSDDPNTLWQCSTSTCNAAGWVRVGGAGSAPTGTPDRCARFNASGVLVAASGDCVSGGGGSGDVSGPASSTATVIPIFDGTTGKLLKQPSVTQPWRIQDAAEHNLVIPMDQSFGQSGGMVWLNGREGHEISIGAFPGHTLYDSGLSTDDTSGRSYNSAGAGGGGVRSAFQPYWAESLEKLYSFPGDETDLRMEYHWNMVRPAHTFTVGSVTGSFSAGDLVVASDPSTNAIKAYGMVASYSAPNMEVYWIGSHTFSTTVANGDKISGAFTTTGSSGSGFFAENHGFYVGPTNCAGWSPAGGHPTYDLTTPAYAHINASGVGGSEAAPTLNFVPTRGDLDDFVSGRCAWGMNGTVKANLGSVTATKQATITSSLTDTHANMRAPFEFYVDMLSMRSETRISTGLDASTITAGDGRYAIWARNTNQSIRTPGTTWNRLLQIFSIEGTMPPSGSGSVSADADDRVFVGDSTFPAIMNLWGGLRWYELDGGTNKVSILSPAALSADAAVSLPTSSGTLGVRIASGSEALTTSAIASGACDTSDDDIAASGVASTDTITWTPNADISGVTGYAPVTSGGLIVYAWPGADEVNFKVCNPTGSSITPGAVTVNWKVTR